MDPIDHTMNLYVMQDTSLTLSPLTWSGLALGVAAVCYFVFRVRRDPIVRDLADAVLGSLNDAGERAGGLVAAVEQSVAAINNTQQSVLALGEELRAAENRQERVVAALGDEYEARRRLAASLDQYATHMEALLEGQQEHSRKINAIIERMGYDH